MRNVDGHCNWVQRPIVQINRKFHHADVTTEYGSGPPPESEFSICRMRGIRVWPIN